MGGEWKETGGEKEGTGKEEEEGMHPSSLVVGKEQDGRSLHPMTPISVQLEDTQVYLGPLMINIL